MKIGDTVYWLDYPQIGSGTFVAYGSNDKYIIKVYPRNIGINRYRLYKTREGAIMELYDKLIRDSEAEIIELTSRIEKYKEKKAELLIEELAGLK